MLEVVKPKELNRLIGAQIYKARTARKLSQEELAELVEVSNVTISHIENGNKSSKISTYYRIASAFDIPLFELFRWDTSDNKSFDEILFLLSDCSTNEIRAYTEILRIVKLLIAKDGKNESNPKKDIHGFCVS